MPGLTTYEAKLLVCGLSRAFFGKANSVGQPIDGQTRSAGDVTMKDSHAKTSSKPAMLTSDESKQFSDKYSGIHSDIGLPFHN